VREMTNRMEICCETRAVALCAAIHAAGTVAVIPRVDHATRRIPKHRETTW